MTNDNILRVKKSCLDLINDAWHFNEVLFTGLAYNFNDQGSLINLIKIENGKDNGVSDDYLATPEDTGNRIDLDFEDDEYDDDYTYWNNLRFCGIGYIFTVSGILTEEISYSFGDRHNESRRWHPTGNLASKYNKDENWHWHENGTLWMHEVNNASGGFAYEIEINDSKAIESLAIENEYSAHPNDIAEHEVSQSLELRGEGINDNVLSEITSKKSFNKLEELSLINTSIYKNTILALDLKNLRTLNLSDNTYMTQDIIEELEAKHPLCTIHSTLSI